MKAPRAGELKWVAQFSAARALVDDGFADVENFAITARTQSGSKSLRVSDGEALACRASERDESRRVFQNPSATAFAARSYAADR